MILKGHFASSASSYFWLITPPEGAPSYLFGTIHVPYSKLSDAIPENVQEAVEVRYHEVNEMESEYFELPSLNYSAVMDLDGWNWTWEIPRTQNTDNTSIIPEDHPRNHFSTISSQPSLSLGIKAYML